MDKEQCQLCARNKALLMANLGERIEIADAQNDSRLIGTVTVSRLFSDLIHDTSNNWMKYIEHKELPGEVIEMPPEEVQIIDDSTVVINGVEYKVCENCMKALKNNLCISGYELVKDTLEDGKIKFSIYSGNRCNCERGNIADCCESTHGLCNTHVKLNRELYKGYREVLSKVIYTNFIISKESFISSLYREEVERKLDSMGLIYEWQNGDIEIEYNKADFDFIRMILDKCKEAGICIWDLEPTTEKKKITLVCKDGEVYTDLLPLCEECEYLIEQEYEYDSTMEYSVFDHRQEKTDKNKLLEWVLRIAETK